MIKIILFLFRSKMDADLKFGLEIFLKILAVYAIILTLFGTLANFLSCYLCSRLNRSKTFVFLTFLFFNDAFTLYFWNLNHFTTTFFGLDIQNYNIWLCKFGQFVQFNSLQTSAWILVF